MARIPITLQTAAIRIVVVPETGAQITSLMDFNGHEYLSSGFSPRPDNLPLYASFATDNLSNQLACFIFFRRRYHAS
jgi:hypothetical protein